MYLVGVPCPGCGVTTAVVLAARGRFADSLAAQPFGFALFLAVAAAAAWALLATAMRRDLAADAGRLKRRAVCLPVAALLAAAWMYKLVAVLG